MTRKPSEQTDDTRDLAEDEKVVDFGRERARYLARKAPPDANAVNRRELCSIKALTAYIAHNQQVSEKTVCTMVEDQFKVQDISGLRREDFERVIEFLVDLRCDLLMN